MFDPLLKISNHHALAFAPLIIEDTKPDQYIGYFENIFGEQWIFTRNLQRVWQNCAAGNFGCNREIDVTDGACGELTLNATEAEWLECCLMQVGPFKVDQSSSRSLSTIRRCVGSDPLVKASLH